MLVYDGWNFNVFWGMTQDHIISVSRYDASYKRLREQNPANTGMFLGICFLSFALELQGELEILNCP